MEPTMQFPHPRPKPSLRLALLAPLLPALFLALLLQATPLQARDTTLQQLDLLVDVRQEIATQYVEEPDTQAITRAAVRAMVGALEDPYTVYLSPEELDPFDKQIRGSFTGIGAEVDLHDDRLRIVSPLDDSPAFHAGVMAGDMVLDIDGVSTVGMSINEAIKRLTGPPGTQVTIKVRHLTGQESDIAITRARINVRTVKGASRQKQNGDDVGGTSGGGWDFMLDASRGIGYIRISQFTDTTADDVRAALDQLLARKVKGIILDLRFNPGGLLESGIAVSDMFLDEGKTIVSVKGRAVPERSFASHAEGTIPPVPMVVLANEASASAAEIVTGALADNGRAVFIGTRTWGKGSVQQIRVLPSDTGALKITNAYYYLPSGRNIHRRKGAAQWGVDPADGFYVPMTTEQVRAMIDHRRKNDVLTNGVEHDGQGDKNGADNANGGGGGADGGVTPASILATRADAQLAAALEAMIGKLETGDWPHVGQDGAAALANEARRELLRQQHEALSKRMEQIDEELRGLDKPGSTNGADKQPVIGPLVPPNGVDAVDDEAAPSPRDDKSNGEAQP